MTERPSEDVRLAERDHAVGSGIMGSGGEEGKEREGGKLPHI